MMDSKPLAQFVRFLTWCSFGSLLLVLVTFIVGLALMLTSCTTSKPAAQMHEENALLHQTNTAVGEPVDSIVQKKCTIATENPALKRRLFGLLPPAQPRKFKNKGTIIYQVGEGNTAASANKPGTMATGAGATATDAQKTEGPVQVGQNNQATDNTKAGQRGGAAATGEGSSATATTTKASWLSAVLPWVVGILVIYSVLPFLPIPGAGWLLLLAIRRGRSREPETG
ncbi:hypothetical protein [Hymenobacter metallicola]|uniref:Uncharacterized protein n=1 Tax=Hymenobacter metallicola TaxID=2563114 RepID=A0A4Z0PYJ6_9BACT|nr:hypothetical protein [Hymenobacter metallicola]TGE22838.1 hypothetical protein E5K02_20955 [Hymenobacter metallicola]